MPKTSKKRKTNLREANSTIVNPLERLQTLFYAVVALLLAAFRSTTIILFVLTLIIIAVLYIFFSLFGLT